MLKTFTRNALQQFACTLDSNSAIKTFTGRLLQDRCLDELLVHIVKCKKEQEQIIIPFSSPVNPSDIRNQKGSYGAAFVAIEIVLSMTETKWMSRGLH